MQQSALPAGAVEHLLGGLEPLRTLQPGFDLGRLAGGGQPDHRTPGHAVSQDTTAGTAAQLFTANQRKGGNSLL